MNDDENWTGGFYELCLGLGAADDDNVDRVLRSLWRAVGVHGCHMFLGPTGPDSRRSSLAWPPSTSMVTYAGR